MKQLAILTLLTAAILASCSKSESTDAPTDLSARTAMVSSGTWKVTQYLDSGKDETSDFSGLAFSFNTDGTIIANSGAASYSGTWILAAKSGSDDSISDDSQHRFTINVTGDKLMDKVSKKWLVEKITETEIWLKDDNVLSNELIRFGK